MIPSLLAAAVMQDAPKSQNVYSLPGVTVTPAGEVISHRFIIEVYDNGPTLSPTLVPCSHIAISKRTSAAWYVTVTIPSVLVYADSLTVGTYVKVIWRKLYSSGDTEDNLIAGFIITQIDYDIGSRSASATITGGSQVLFESNDSRDLTEVIRFYSQSEKYRAQVGMTTAIQPGDIVTYDAVSFTVDWINIQIGLQSISMEIGED